MEAFLERCDFYLNKGVVPAEARAQAGLDVLKRQATRTIIPRFAETFIREVWEMQTRLLNPKPQQIEALAGHARFRAGFDFLLFVRNQVIQYRRHGCLVGSYQEMSIDQKKRIRQYNRQRTKSRRKTAEVDEPKTTEIEPLVNVPEPKNRRAKKERVRTDESTIVLLKKRLLIQDKSCRSSDFKRKRVQRDLAKWFLDRRNDYSYLYWFRQ
jgi:poly(A) polymerase